MGFGSILGSILKQAPKIAGGIGKVVDTGRKIGQIIDTGRKVGAIANQISGGRLAHSGLGQNVSEAVNRVENINNKVISGGNRAIGKIGEFEKVGDRLWRGS